MKRLILLLLAGLLFSQEYPALRLEEFTIVGIDTLKARRGIVDVIPGFRTSIPIPDPDLAGFIVDKFPVKTIEIKPPETNEKKKLLYTSFGFGLRNNLHFQLTAAKNRGTDVVLANFRALGPAGGSKGVTELDGSGFYFKKLSNTSLLRLSAGIYGKWDRATGNGSDIGISYLLPSFAIEFAKYPVPSGLFLRTNFGLKFLTLRSDLFDTKNRTALDFDLETGFTSSMPFKISGVLSHRAFGGFSVTSGKINMLFGAGALKSAVSAGYAYPESNKGTPIGSINLVFPAGSKLKFLLNSRKAFQMADYIGILKTAAMVSDFGRLDEELFEVTGGINFSTDFANIRLLAGYRQYQRPSLLVKKGSFWTLQTDTTKVDGGVLKLELGDLQRFDISGEFFIGGDKYKSDTLLPRGKGVVSFVNPEGRILPGFKFGIITAFFGDDLLISQGLEVYKTVAGSFGAFVELTNPIKEGFEIFTPSGYDISNGFSITMGFTLKF